MASRRGAGPAFDSSRRVFRGRAGATDSNLPKHQARRRRKQTKESDLLASQLRLEDADTDTQQQSQREVSTDSDSSKKESLESLKCTSSPQTSVLELETPPDPQDNLAFQSEIRHLLRRIRHVRESIQLSSEVLANTTTWQQNVLNAVRNCVGEWRAILSHHEDDLMGNDDDSLCKEPSLKTFELLQRALQSGPLVGSKAGYFKRCGGATAKTALEFMNAVVPDRDEAAYLRFTVKQQETFEKWRANAMCAAENDKAPSKSVLKKQTKAAKMKKKKK